MGGKKDPALCLGMGGIPMYMYVQKILHIIALLDILSEAAISALD